MGDGSKGPRTTRRQVLGATAGALAVGVLPKRSSAQQASGPTVYVGIGSSNYEDAALYAVDADSGSQEWAFTQPSRGVYSSPTVADGTVYVGSDDSNLYAVDADSGSQEWAFTQPSASVRSSPTVADGTVYVGSNDDTLYAVDAATGRKEWAFTQPFGVVRSSPTVADGTVYVGSHDDTLYAVDAATGEQEWAFIQPSDSVESSPTVADGTVYVGSYDSMLYAVDAATGEREWAFTQPSGGVFSSPTVADGTVYVGSNDSTLYAVDADSGEQEWGFTQPSNGVNSSPTVADGTVYVGSNDDTLYAVDAATGSQEWGFTQPSDGVDSSPTVADGTVYVGSWDETLYAVDAATGSQEWGFTQPSAPVESSPTVVADPASGDSVGSRVLLGTLGHHDERADRVTTVAPAFFEVSIEGVTESTAGETLDVTVAVENTGDTPGEQTVELSASGLGTDSTTVSLDGDDSTTETLSLSTGDGDAGEYTLTVDAGDDEATETVIITAPSGDDGSSNGGGGFGTTEMAAVGGGGGLALLLGAYALMRRSGGNNETDPDQMPPTSTESESSGLNTEASTHRQSSDSDSKDSIDDRLKEVTRTLDNAEQLFDDGRYDRALSHCEQAVATAQETHTAARQRVPNRVSEAETAVEDATALRETIQAQQQARQRVLEELNQAEQKLETAAALDSNKSNRASAYLNDADSALTDAGETLEEHDLPNLADRLATLETRHKRLQQAPRETQTQTRTRTPTEIPDVTRRSLSYADIEKRSELGRGGNADVSQATALTDGGDIALKEPRMGGGETLHTETVERMMQEAETWQQLDDHDHIVGVIDYGTQPVPWIGMEYMDGGHLDDRAGEMSFQQALWTAIAITEGVRYAHRRGVAHLDLKPANILFRRVENGWDAPKIADWGLSKHLLNHSNSVEGLSPQYAAPEQFDDSYGSTDDITDIYQLGAVFYELFTNRPPFDAPPARVMNQVLSESPPSPSTIADVPSELDKILLTALEKKKSARYESVLYLRDDLQELFDYF